MMFEAPGRPTGEVASRVWESKIFAGIRFLLRDKENAVTNLNVFRTEKDSFLPFIIKAR